MRVIYSIVASVLANVTFYLPARVINIAPLFVVYDENDKKRIRQKSVRVRVAISIRGSPRTSVSSTIVTNHVPPPSTTDIVVLLIITAETRTVPAIYTRAAPRPRNNRINIIIQK